MPVTFRQTFAVAALTLAAAVADTRTAEAQVAERKGAPDKGTWGAETSSGAGQNATLLLFVSPKWALQGGGGINSFESGNSPGRYTTSNLLLGVRRYGGTGLGFRPIAGAGATLGTATGSGQQLGVFGELGASYFFNRHLSLGANGTATYLNGDGTSALQIGVARLTAALFF
jgi:hypothetical protein